MSVIRFDTISKAYDLHSGSRTLVSSLRAIAGNSREQDLFYALKDVSFDIGRGEAFGIIGKNGAGKSTILKIIAGITKPTSGTVTVNGLVSSLIELGSGFHPDMTGKENVYMSGAILGIPRKSIDIKFKEIVDFAELWDFIDVPVKKYSSGMYARLGFAVAISVEPDILIVDEILSVGDVFFQQKCFAKMRKIIEKGTTFIFVTHDTAAMQNLCDRAILLDAGKIEFIGTTTEAVNRYYANVGQKPERTDLPESKNIQTDVGSATMLMTAEKIRAHSILTKNCKRHGQRGLEVAAAVVTNDQGNHTFQVSILEKLSFYVLLHANEDIVEPTAGMNLYDRMGNLVFAAGTPQLKHRLPSLSTGEELIVRFELSFSVKPDEYTFSLIASEPSVDGSPNIGYFHDQYDMLGPILVIADTSKVFPFYGIAQLPMSISHRSLQKPHQ